MSLPFAAVVAMDEERGIGKAGGLAWRLPGEMAYFKRVTSNAGPGRQNAVVMGRTTFASIPAKFRPLPGRINVVLSRDPGFTPAGVITCRSFEAALSTLADRRDLDQVFVGGGAALYAETLLHPGCQRVYLTRIEARCGCDAFLAEFEHAFQLVHRDGPHVENGLRYSFEVYERKAAEAEARGSTRPSP